MGSRPHLPQLTKLTAISTSWTEMDFYMLRTNGVAVITDSSEHFSTSS